MNVAGGAGIGRAFGTELSPDDKQALIELLKTF